MSGSIFFNAFHSPIGAHASFTLGCKGRKGGLGLELGKPADENVFIGVETRQGGVFEALPFWEGGEDESLRFDHMAEGGEKPSGILRPFASERIERVYRAGKDLWKAGDLELEIISPLMAAPDPAKASLKDQKLAYCPAVLLELRVDNRAGKKARTAFLGYEGQRSDGTNLIDGKLKGVESGRSTALMTDCVDAVPARGFNAPAILSEKHPENLDFGLGGTGLLLFNVPAGEKKTFHVTACFHRGGIVTSGAPCSYYYARFFKEIEEVGAFALKSFELYKKKAAEAVELFTPAKLNESQVFQLAHSVNSYYGSTQLLDWDGEPFWVVNEGEYRMMNTFDLTVDQLFFEMKLNPWTVKNELDMFVMRYSYKDKLHTPGGANEHEGGLSFTHDMGHRNVLARKGRSAYERAGLDGCFSYMTHEQLANWVLCAAVYVKKSGSNPWPEVFKKCLESMLNRDNPDPAKRNGVMAFDSSRTVDGAEITTYDSLDASLGQARANAYLALKCFAAYLALADVFKEGKLAETALKQARLAAGSVVEAAKRKGFVPALLDGSCDAKIIPAVEGLVFPWILGQMDKFEEGGEFNELFETLKAHFKTIMKPGVCLYPDGGWKLSSSADNSWLSKIYLCQFVARHVLGCAEPFAGNEADKAHRAWLLKEENLYWAWSDQIRSGVAKGSKYYPRGVTSVLWLEE